MYTCPKAYNQCRRWLDHTRKKSQARFASGSGEIVGGERIAADNSPRMQRNLRFRSLTESNCSIRICFQNRIWRWSKGCRASVLKQPQRIWCKWDSKLKFYLCESKNLQPFSKVRHVNVPDYFSEILTLQASESYCEKQTSATILFPAFVAVVLKMIASHTMFIWDTRSVENRIVVLLLLRCSFIFPSWKSPF